MAMGYQWRIQGGCSSTPLSRRIQELRHVACTDRLTFSILGDAQAWTIFDRELKFPRYNDAHMRMRNCTRARMIGSFCVLSID